MIGLHFYIQTLTKAHFNLVFYFSFSYSFLHTVLGEAHGPGTNVSPNTTVCLESNQTQCNLEENAHTTQTTAQNGNGALTLDAVAMLLFITNYPICYITGIFGV